MLWWCTYFTLRNVVPCFLLKENIANFRKDLFFCKQTPHFEWNMSIRQICSGWYLEGSWMEGVPQPQETWGLTIHHSCWLLTNCDDPPSRSMWKTPFKKPSFWRKTVMLNFKALVKKNVGCYQHTDSQWISWRLKNGFSAYKWIDCHLNPLLQPKLFMNTIRWPKKSNVIFFEKKKRWVRSLRRLICFRGIFRYLCEIFCPWTPKTMKNEGFTTPKCRL